MASVPLQRVPDSVISAPFPPAAAALRAERLDRTNFFQGSFSDVSKPNFARKYAFESSRRDLHNALLCTALQSQNFVKYFGNILLNSVTRSVNAG